MALPAAEWTFNAGISVSEEFTDNVDLVADSLPKEHDFITDIAPSVSVRGVGARASADFDYTLRQLITARTDNDERIHELNARGQLEFLERIGFLDAGATVTRQPGATGGTSFNSAAGQLSNQVNVQSFNVSPSLVHRIGQWVNAQIRGNFGLTNVESATESDSHNYGGAVTLAGGRAFGRLQWTANASRQTQARTGGAGLDDVTTLQADLDLTFAISRFFSIIGGIGYEDIEDNTLNSAPKGITWRAGLGFNPNPRTSFIGTVGRRFDDLNISVEASHQITERTVIRALVSDSLSNSQSLVLGDTAFIGTDDDGDLIDTRTGLPFDAGTSLFGLESNTFRRRRAEANISSRRQRTTLAAGGFYERRQTDATGITEIGFGANVNASRQLSRRTTASAGVDYTNTDFGDAAGRRDHQIEVDASLSYQIFRQVSAIIGFRRTQRMSNDSAFDVTENTASVQLRSDF